MEMPADQCKWCKAAIFWASTEKTGRAMPIDLEPVANGNLVVSLSTTSHFVARYLKKNEATTDRRYVSHFATCPAAAKFRKG